MITRLQNDIFDVMIEPSDWRYSAAIVGLSKYFRILEKVEEEDYKIEEECFKFQSDCITEKEFLKFAELYYGDDFPHVQLERYLSFKDEFTEDGIDFVNKLFKANTIMKNVFAKLKFDGSNKETILKVLEANRQKLIRETFRNKTSMYANFSNKGQLLTGSEKKKTSRLCGYYVDPGRKSKSISFNFNDKIYVFEETQLFDFIPFAFFGGRESFFVNDSYSVKSLIFINKTLSEKLQKEMAESENKHKDGRKILFQAIQESADYIDYDVEVILKDYDREFFETLYVRKDSINVLRKFDKYPVFCFGMQLKNNYYLNVQKEVLDCILNLQRTDSLIEFFLREDRGYLVHELIKLNMYIEGRKNDMALELGKKSAFKCAKILMGKLSENKVKSYRQRLINALVLKDYEGYCRILIQLVGYANMTFEFAYDLFEDFEKNLDIAYSFVNALGTKDAVDDTKKKQKAE